MNLLAGVEGTSKEDRMEQSYRRANESGTGVVGLRLLFRLTRSRIKGISVEGLPQGTQVAKKSLFQLGAEAMWDSALSESAEVTATVEYEGEPLVLTDFVWITEGAQDNILESVAKPVDPLKEAQLANNPLETVLEDPLRLFDARREAIERTVDPKIKKYQLFYWHYDHETHPSLIVENPDIPAEEKARRRFIIVQTAPVLSRRVLERARMARAGETPDPNGLPQVPDVSWVEYLSGLQLDIMRQYLPDDNQELDAAACGEAFEMFTNGELRVEVIDGVWNSEPDSAYEFSFAEFALLAIDKGVHTDEWGSLLNGLVRSQEIFTLAYRPNLPPPYYYSDYGSTNFAPEKQVDAAFKQQLRERYEGKSSHEITEQAGKNAAAAFPAGPQRPAQGR
jgi:hypothetical protein